MHLPTQLPATGRTNSNKTRIGNSKQIMTCKKITTKQAAGDVSIADEEDTRKNHQITEKQKTKRRR
jgi:hypothetical protein